MVTSTHSSGMLRMSSMQSPMNKTVGVPELKERTAWCADLYVRTFIKAKHNAFWHKDPAKIASLAGQVHIAGADFVADEPGSDKSVRLRVPPMIVRAA